MPKFPRGSRSDDPISSIVTELEVLSRRATIELERGGKLSPRAYETLRQTTDELVRAKVRLGELNEHPYSTIRRSIPHVQHTIEYIAGKRILVTGAGGTIGSLLSQEVLRQKPALLGLLDRDQRRLKDIHRVLAANSFDVPVRALEFDVSEERDVAEAFAAMRPEVVFHLAAERSPENAQAAVRDAVLTNVLGSQLLARYAHQCGVERFILASTGKCRHIFDPRVYPATKKYAEIVTRAVAVRSSTRFSLVRFHHVVDNSLVELRFRRQVSESVPLTVHLPADRRQHGQSAQEAVAMLLRAGTYGQDAEVFGSTLQMSYFSILDLALYILKESGQSLPILFKEPREQDGYVLSEFPGLRLTHDDRRLTHSFNMIETVGYRVLHEMGLVMTSFPRVELNAVEAQAEAIVRCVTNCESGDGDMRSALAINLRAFAEDAYAQAPLDLVLESLVRGVESDNMTAVAAAAHAPIMAILLRALLRRSDLDLSYKQQTALTECFARIRSLLTGRAGVDDLLAAIAVLSSKLSG